MYIRIDKADKVFSQYIRLRDSRCVRCESRVRLKDGLPVSHHNSHYFGRGKESTRFDPENCDTLCYGCHQIWGSNDREAYRQFKINQLGETGFDLLQLRSNAYSKKDRKMRFIESTLLLKELTSK